MKFGALKSKIEEKLSNSYINETFDKEIKVFNELVLEKKNVAKAYYLYDELSKPKGFDIDYAKDYLNECIEQYENIFISENTLDKIKYWVKDIKVKNKYSNIDNIFNKDSVLIESIIDSKKLIIETLASSKVEIKKSALPHEYVVTAAKESLSKYLETLNESQLLEIKKYKSLSESDIKSRYDVLSEMAIEKLNLLYENNDSETKDKISSTIDRIKSDQPNAITLYKLKQLTESL